MLRLLPLGSRSGQRLQIEAFLEQARLASLSCAFSQKKACVLLTADVFGISQTFRIDRT